MKVLLYSLLLVLLALPTMAFESQDITNNLSYKEQKVYNKDFDILVADFIVPDNNGEDDVLQALTVYNTRNTASADITKLILWADNGDNIWQGYMLDEQLSEGVKVDYRKWVFENIDYTIPTNGLHLYLSIETGNTITSDRKVQFEVQRLSDIDSDGNYDSGDSGVFVESDNDGPTDQSMLSGYVYTLENKTRDILAPKAIITNIVDGGEYNVVDSFLIEGVAKDRMQGSPKIVRVSMVPSGELVTWQDVVALTTNFATWSYSFDNLPIGTYDVQIYVSDWDYNTHTADIMTVTLIEPIIESEDEEIIEDEIELPETPVEEDEVVVEMPIEEADKLIERLIKTDTNPTVYLLKDNMRHWFYNEFVFRQYYDNFSTLEIISKEEMSGYIDGEYMPMKAENLIKQATSNKVYETGASWQMRWILDEEEAIDLYGHDWAENITVIPYNYFMKYKEVDSL